MVERVVVFDIETVPDLEVARVALRLSSDLANSEVRRALGVRFAKSSEDWETAFVKAPLHRIVCIGAIYAERDDRLNPWIITRSGVGHVGLRTEHDLVASFIESLAAAPSPQVVGFNSSSFDFPVLRYRAFALSIPAHVIHKGNGRDYWYRYGRDHIDLCDVMSGFGASAKASLSELAALCGLPAKTNGIEGSQVEALVNDNRLPEVAAYCEVDVITTYLLFLRYELLIGEMARKSYHESMIACREFLEKRLEKRPHVTPFLASLLKFESLPHDDRPA